MCKAVCILCAQTNLVEQVGYPVVFLLFAQMKVNIHSLRDDFSDGHTRVQRSVWVLEDDLNILFKFQQVLALEGGNILAVKNHLAGGRLIELDHGASAGGLAAAGLANQTQRLAAADADRDVVHSLERLLASCFKELAQVGDLQNIVCVLQCFNYLIHY